MVEGSGSGLGGGKNYKNEEGNWKKFSLDETTGGNGAELKWQKQLKKMKKCREK